MNGLGKAQLIWAAHHLLWDFSLKIFCFSVVKELLHKKKASSFKPVLVKINDNNQLLS